MTTMPLVTKLEAIIEWRNPPLNSNKGLLQSG
jgi:hypothetical protein